MDTTIFKRRVQNYYHKHGRRLPWRAKSATPYQILVSEVMLQQTQVDRVVPKYKAFLKQFPSFRALAKAKQSDIIKAWSGLGYNRRALNLQKTATIVTQKYHGKLPHTYGELVELPGIGSYTAGALLAFVFNTPTVFIETNIRTVFIHHYYDFIDKTILSGDVKIDDEDLLVLVEKTLDTKNPREWYYALMDYGAHLKKTVGNPNTQSRHYTKQSRFEGSRRQLRGKILKALGSNTYTAPALARVLGKPVEQITDVLADLTAEGFVEKKANRFTLA